MRLDKYLSDASPFSRREIKNLIRQKRVRVNRELAVSPAMNVAVSDEIEVDGQRWLYRKYIYLMLHKPQGFVSATEDARDPVVVDLVPEKFRHYAVFPVGRLDKDTEGLLLLTNDGDFDHRLTSPKKEVVKRYFARLDLPMAKSDAEIFASGMDLGDFTAKPAKIFCADEKKPCEVIVAISEGKFHQVKRMCEKVGKKVLYLKRLAIGELELDAALAPGEMRELREEELALFLPDGVRE